MAASRAQNERHRRTTIASLSTLMIFLHFHLATAQSCVPYYSEQNEQALWCSEFFSQCDCVSVSSSTTMAQVSLSEAELQIGRIINQADLFGVSRSCRSSFVSLYCHQVYTVDSQEMTNTGPEQQFPSEWQICTDDCERTIVTDCGGDWNILTNIIAQFIARGTIQLPHLRQLGDCAVNLEPVTDGTGMERNTSQPCISLQPPPSLNSDCLNTQQTPSDDRGDPSNLPFILGVSIGLGSAALLLLVILVCCVSMLLCCSRRQKMDDDGDPERVDYHRSDRTRTAAATNPAIEIEYVEIDDSEPGSTIKVDRKEVKSNGTLMLRSSMLHGALLDVNMSPRTSTLTRHIGTKDFIKMSPKQRLHSLEFPHDNICLMKNLWETNLGWTCLGEASGIFQNELSSTVFIKSLRENASSKLKQQFRIEMTWASGFSHPNVIQLLAVCTKEQPQYMIFEYLEYGSLKDFLQSIDSAWDDFDTALNDASSTCPSSQFSPALGLEDLVNISWQVANGMDYLTKKAFVLKDLTTRNCQVGQGLRVKISNFGLSYDKHCKDYYCLSSRKSMPLPLRWLAPETIQHNKVSVYSDIWSFGVLLWEVFSSGQRPYGDLSNAQVVQNILGHKLLPQPDNCPKAAYRLMLRCWNKAPMKRPWFSTLMEELKQVTSNLDPEDIKMLESSPKTPDLLRRL